MTCALLQILVGDLNVANEDIDLANPKGNVSVMDSSVFGGVNNSFARCVLWRTAEEQIARIL